MMRQEARAAPLPLGPRTGCSICLATPTVTSSSVTVTFGAGPAVIIDNDVAGPDADGNDISDPGPGTSKAWIDRPDRLSTDAQLPRLRPVSPPTQGQLFFVVTHTCRWRHHPDAVGHAVAVGLWFAERE